MVNYEIARARSVLDDFFWNVFCDDYLEMIKGRVNSLMLTEPDSPEIADAMNTARYAQYTILRLYAPFMPYIAEEAYHILTGLPDESSIHGESMEDLTGISLFPEAEDEYDYLAEVISRIRAYKSSKKISLSAPLQNLEIHGKKKEIELHADMIRDVMKIGSLKVIDSQEISVSETD